MLLSTHIVSDIEYIANEILLMKDGKIRASGTSDSLIAAMSRQVWHVEVPKEEFNTYRRLYKVSNVKTVPGGLQLRILSADKPSEDAVLETAALEDLFLDYFGETAGEWDDEI